MKLIQAIVNNARILENPQFAEAAEVRQKRINDCLPSGSGFDAGTKIESVSDSRVVFSTSFHHMDENGFYDGWTEHKVTIKADLLVGFTVHVSGRNHNDIKDYIGQVFHDMLSDEFDWIEKE